MLNPGLMGKLRYLKGASIPGIARFEHLLQEIRTIVYDRLRTTVEEEKAKQDQLSVIIAKEQKTSNEVKLLMEEVEKARHERSNEISKRNEVIRKLKEDLRLIKHEAEETTRKLESRSKQKEDSDIQKFVDKETALQREIDTSRAQFKENLKENREEEEQLRKKKFKIESEVENWIHKYDQEMEEKQNEYEDISVIYNEEKAQLDELQARFNVIQLEYDTIVEERMVAAEINKVCVYNFNTIS
jgi:chromosome segregation ATPase